MKFIIFALSTFICFSGFAKSTSRDFGSSTGKVDRFNQQKLIKRLKIRGDAYVTDESGEIIKFRAQQTRSWNFDDKDGGFTSFWAYSSDQITGFYVKHVWKIDAKGRIKVHFQRYSKMENRGGEDPKLGKLLHEKHVTVKNFSNVIYSYMQNGSEKVVLRFTLDLPFKDETVEITGVPISGKNLMMSDSRGKLWMADASFSGKYIKIKTVAGTIRMSFSKFPGAKELGAAEGNKMELKLNSKHKAKLISTSAFVPAGMKAKVFAKVDLAQKTAKGHTQIWASDELDGFN